ncbi:MAG TPA: M23 family metallopeptidase [Acidimicrobiales bacterium]|nr:M23 family metallopeptidase [Acidimicrobiales bacterium]
MNLRRLAPYAIVVALLVGAVAPDQASASAASRRRDAARAQRAAAARKLDALKASDTQLDAAVRTLDKQVASQEAATQAARQAVAAADAAQRQAETKLAQTETQTARLRGSLVQRAVESYMRPQRDNAEQVGSASSLGELSRRTALLQHMAKSDRDVLDRLRAVREDLVLDREKAAAARATAAERRKVVTDRLATLQRDRAAKGRLASALDQRIREVQSEVDALNREAANLSAALSKASSGRASRGGTFEGKVSGSGLAWPVRGPVTSEYGYRWGRQHAGIDVGAGTGTPIYAAKSGTVIHSGTMGGYGNVVIIDHGGGFTTLYAHQSRLGSREGQSVNQGQVIGYVGSTGNSTGPHLHFETRVNGSAQNPRRYLP